jgi:DNA-binding NtrC family response regulator
MTRTILIVDDDPRVRTSLAQGLAKISDDVRAAEHAQAALASVGHSAPDVVVADVRMPGVDGLELLRILGERAPEVSVIMMTAFDDLPTVATAMREGAVEFLVKPIDLRQLIRVIERVFDDRQAKASARTDGATEPVRVDGEDLIGHHPAMIEIFKVVGQAAATRANVLVRGESGTGKELIARAIHRSSPDAEEPFVPVNCTALPPSLLESELFGHVKGSFTGAVGDRRGRFAQAGRGTIFLDEIGDTAPDFQSKLLRVLQEQEFYPVGSDRPQRTAARVIAATHRDLESLVATGDFREDLYYRMRVVEIVVPPLHERVSDLPALAAHLIAKASRATGGDAPVVSTEAIDALLDHTWPGNVRELENCLTRALVLAKGDVIRPEHLTLSPPTRTPARQLTTLERLEGEHVAEVLRATNGHKSRAAKILGVSRPRLDRLIEKHELDELLGHFRDGGASGSRSL